MVTGTQVVYGAVIAYAGYAEIFAARVVRPVGKWSALTSGFVP